jgi:hypothetical protein
MTILDVAKHLQVSWGTIKDIQKRYLKRRYRNPSLKNIHRIAIDEISIGIRSTQRDGLSLKLLFNIYSKFKIKKKLAYMHANPVSAGLVSHAENWIFGSARWYLLGKSVGVPIAPPQ